MFYNNLVRRAFAPCLAGPGYDSRPSQTKDFKLVVEAPLPNARHIKGSSMKKLIDARIMRLGGISGYNTL